MIHRIKKKGSFGQFLLIQVTHGLRQAGKTPIAMLLECDKNR